MTQSNWSFPVVQCQQKIEQLPPSTSWAQLQQRWQQEATSIDKGAPCHANHQWIYLPANYPTIESPNVDRKESKCQLGSHRLNLNNVVDQKPATSSKEHYAILATIHSSPNMNRKWNKSTPRRQKLHPIRHWWREAANIDEGTRCLPDRDPSRHAVQHWTA